MVTLLERIGVAVRLLRGFPRRACVAYGLIAFEMAKAAMPSTDIQLTSVDALSHARKKSPYGLLSEN
jgi:hypothetical protein